MLVDRLPLPEVSPIEGPTRRSPYSTSSSLARAAIQVLGKLPIEEMNLHLMAQTWAITQRPTHKLLDVVQVGCKGRWRLMKKII